MSSVTFEIEEQPERQRYKAEGWGGPDVRRFTVFVPRTGDMLADLDAIFAKIKAELAAKNPGLVKVSPKVEEAGDLKRVPPDCAALSREHIERYPVIMNALRDSERAEDAALAALRAEAEAAGVRVDGRWGEERLRQEIASARPAVATLGDAWPASDEPERE